MGGVVQRAQHVHGHAQQDASADADHNHGAARRRAARSNDQQPGQVRADHDQERDLASPHARERWPAASRANSWRSTAALTRMSADTRANPAIRTIRAVNEVPTGPNLRRTGQCRATAMPTMTMAPTRVISVAGLPPRLATLRRQRSLPRRQAPASTRFCVASGPPLPSATSPLVTRLAAGLSALLPGRPLLPGGLLRAGCPPRGRPRTAH